MPDRVTGIPAPGTSVGATGLPEAGAVTGAGRPTGARRTLRAQDVVVDPGARLVYVGGVAITMPRKEMELLLMLVGASGTVVSREELATAAWGEQGAPPKSLDVHIRRLRRRIETDDHHPTHIRTVRGVGYIFDTAPLVRQSARPDRRTDDVMPEPASYAPVPQAS